MSYARALADAKRWAECIRAYGVPVSIELQPGAGGNHWWIGTHEATMGHHTVSRPSQGKTPVLAMVKRGRPDVPGPLCNAYGGYDHVARIITMGRANHPGAGGPIVLAGKRIPKDNGRPYFLGWEFEGGLLPWTEEDHDFQARCLAGTLDFLGAPLDAYCEHSSWAPSRKVDRLGYTRAQGLRRIQAVKGQVNTTTVSQEDEMANYAEQLDQIMRIVTENQRRVSAEGRTVRFIQKEGSGAIYAVDGLTKVGVPNLTVLAKLKEIWGDSEVVPVDARTFDVIPTRSTLTAAQVAAAVKEALAGLSVEADQDAIATAVVDKLAGGLEITGTITTAKEN